jgi:hypothetical protein
MLHGFTHASSRSEAYGAKTRWSYVRELLMRLHADDIRVEEMLPDRWAKQHPEAVLQHRLEESRVKAAAKRDRRRRRRVLAGARPN